MVLTLAWQDTSLLSRIGWHHHPVQFWPLMSLFYVMKPGIINFVGPLLWQFDKAQESLLRIIFSMHTIIHRITNEANYHETRSNPLRLRSPAT